MPDVSLVIQAGETEQTQLQLPGVPATVQGIGTFVGKDTPISWTAAADVTTVPAGDGDWQVAVGPLTALYGEFINPDLAPFGNYEAISVFGDPDFNIDRAQSADNISIQFGTEVPLGNSFLLTAPGATLESGSINETGPYTFTFAALDNGLPVSIGGWTFSVETPSGDTPSWSYTVDPLTDTVTVNTIDANVPGVDAVIVATPDSKITTLSVTAETIPLDAWSLSVAPELVACFVAGTCVSTAEGGEVRVEQLEVGNRISTRDGLKPVRWIGTRVVNCDKHSRPEEVWPIHVTAHAFAPNQPKRDLWLSPDHAVFVDGVLIAIRQFINGATIKQEPRTEVTYWHVEFDEHAVIFAEGLPCESYLDTGNRGAFANGRTPVQLHQLFDVGAAFKSRHLNACAPFVIDAEQVEPIWRRLVQRAEMLGYKAFAPDTPGEPELQVNARGRKMRPLTNGVKCGIFEVPDGADAVQLISRTSAPSDTRPWVNDRRRLGVCVERITVWMGREQQQIALNHPSLRTGWHAVEREDTRMWRWTDGEAVIPLPPGVTMLKVELSGALEYPLDGISDTSQTSRRPAPSFAA